MIRDHETLSLLLDAVSRFVRERLVPAENEVAETDEIPADIVAEMRELGLFGLSIPEEYGGLGLTMEEEVLVAFEIGKTSPCFRSLFGTNVGIGSQGIIIDGTAAQKQHYLPRLASGELIASFALTEPGSGSDAASLSTRAVRDGDHYVINGTKRFITNAPEAGIFTVMARSNPDVKGASGISAFIVERGIPGVSLGKIDKKMGQKGTHTCDVIFENCRVPAQNLIGGVEGIGFKTAARRRDNKVDVSTEASCCKLFASEMCGRVADRAVQIHGGAGYVSEYAIERFYRDVRLFRIYEGTSQIQQLVIARNMMRDAII
ncbi:acyl-CoA dehydrogenase family protein [Paraburkholderia sp. RL18-085-BIA-A]|uniref:acyl-CoA dehydrogenase family protein n=1 Tax=Paraburkholderia sp. RL18-085-BIA-A TaxID=3031633 RepID=UPI0038BAE110